MYYRIMACMMANAMKSKSESEIPRVKARKLTTEMNRRRSGAGHLVRHSCDPSFRAQQHDGPNEATSCFNGGGGSGPSVPRGGVPAF